MRQTGEEWSIRGRKLSHCHFVHHKDHTDWPAVNIVLHLPHVPEELAASFCIGYWRTASICISTYRRNSMPPSAWAPTGGTCLHLHHLPEELNSICITYRRNFPPSASHTRGTCLHLHHLPEERASICITYRRNLPPSAGRPLNASFCITYGRNVLLHLHNVSEELTTSICVTYWRNLNAFMCTTYHSARTCQMVLQTLPEFTVPYSRCLQAIFVCLNCPT